MQKNNDGMKLKGVYLTTGIYQQMRNILNFTQREIFQFALICIALYLCFKVFISLKAVKTFSNDFTEELLVIFMNFSLYFYSLKHLYLSQISKLTDDRINQLKG